MTRGIAPTNPREGGVVMVLALVCVISLLAFTAVSVDLMRTFAASNRSEEQVFRARSIAESGLAQGLARLKDGGQVAPVSGAGTVAVWVPFGAGEFYYTAAFDPLANVSTITAWGRVPVDATPSGSPFSPDDVNWDGSGYLVQGVELTVQSYRYMPSAPAYFGNGGFQMPIGGFEWNSSVDPFDPSTWSYVTSNPASYQSSSIPFMVNALDHPLDYLDNGGTPTSAGPGIHPFNLFTNQNAIGQLNTTAWFQNSAGSGYDPLTNVWPSPSSTSYSSDPASSDHAFPVDESLPDVQDYSWALWSKYESVTTNVQRLAQGSHSGTIGSLAAPEVVFVTGHLTVPSGQTLKGTGVLVIRDDFDPNVDTNNTPALAAGLTVEGNLDWTGMVIISGWNPILTVRSGGAMRVVGTLMGEDSVMSGGEISLNSAAIIIRVEDTLELRFCSSMFQPGGLLYDMLPMLRREVIGVRERFAS